MKEKYFILFCVSMFFSGCVVKNTDTNTEKTLKHIVNSPVYVIYGVGAVATKAVEAAAYGTLYVGTKAAKATTDTIKETKNSISNDNKEEIKEIDISENKKTN